MSNQNQLKTRKALIKHEMEQLETELTRTKRQIDKHEDYTMPRLEKQLVRIDNDLTVLEAKRSAMGVGQPEQIMNQLELSRFMT